VSSSLPPDVADARIRLGQAYRSLGHAIVGHHVSAADLNALADRLTTGASDIREGEHRVRSLERPSGDWGPGPADGEEMFSFDERPISGRAALLEQLHLRPVLAAMDNDIHTVLNDF